MSADNHPKREKEIFELALELPSAGARFSYVKGACGGDAELLTRVQTLLRVHEATGNFLPESTNGTYRNDRRVTQPVKLAEGDRLMVGGINLVFRHNGQANFGGDGAETMNADQTRIAVKIEQAWLVLADIEGFTTFSQAHPPEEVSRVSGEWMLTCWTLFEKNNADIQIYTGDGFLSYVIDRGDGAQSFFRILAGLREFQARERVLPFRLLVHHDYITLGGSSPAGGESVLGPGVILLFRMEKIAKAGHSRLSLTTAAVEKWTDKISPVSLGRHRLGSFEQEHELFSLELARNEQT